jgi:hypothetical protein
MIYARVLLGPNPRRTPSRRWQALFNPSSTKWSFLAENIQKSALLWRRNVPLPCIGGVLVALLDMTEEESQQ